MGGLLSGTPAWGLQPLGSLTAEEEEEKSKVRQQCINGQSASGKRAAGRHPRWAVEEDVRKVDFMMEMMILSRTSGICCVVG